MSVVVNVFIEVKGQDGSAIAAAQRSDMTINFTSMPPVPDDIVREEVLVNSKIAALIDETRRSIEEQMRDWSNHWQQQAGR